MSYVDEKRARLSLVTPEDTPSDAGAQLDVARNLALCSSRRSVIGALELVIGNAVEDVKLSRQFPEAARYKAALPVVLPELVFGDADLRAFFAHHGGVPDDKPLAAIKAFAREVLMKGLAEQNLL